MDSFPSDYKDNRKACVLQIESTKINFPKMPFPARVYNKNFARIADFSICQIFFFAPFKSTFPFAALTFARDTIISASSARILEEIYVASIHFL